MNAKFIFWRNIEYLMNDNNWGKLAFEEREVIRDVQKRNTAKPVPYPEDSKLLKQLVEVVKDRNQDQKRMIDGLYQRPIGRI